MLIELHIANFRSFHAGQTFSFVANNKDKSHANNLIPCKGYHLLKSAAIFGANASGKSNLLKALSIMRQFVVISATRMTEGDVIPGIEPFLLARATVSLPSRLEVILLIGTDRYRYGFEATSKRVHAEWLFITGESGRERLLFERRYDAEKNAEDFTPGTLLRREEKLLKERTRDNGLMLSVGAREKVSVLTPVYNWFRNQMRVLDFSQSPDSLIAETAERIRQDSAFKQRVLKFACDADIDIQDIDIEERIETLPPEIHEQVISLASLTHDMLSLNPTVDEFVQGDLRMRRIITRHRMIDSEDLTNFDFLNNESKGTQRLFAIAGLLLNTIEKGSLLVIDEMECSMNSILARSLIEFFQSGKIASNGAQLLFATQDTVLLDPILFRRDQLYLVEKRSGGSKLFSLYDFNAGEKPRNTEAFQRNYLAGRYGGVPRLGATFEDLEL